MRGAIFFIIRSNQATGISFTKNNFMSEYLKRWPELKEFIDDVKEMMSQYQRPAEQVIMDEADAIFYLKVSKRCLSNWREQGVLPFHKLGGKIYYIQSEVLDAIKSGRIKIKNKAKF